MLSSNCSLENVGVLKELAGLCPSSLEQADYVQYRKWCT
ncbi:MAG: hypothetical protein CM15mP49_13650 [Actinomycetota bacterium]|nr:MAG: hypothetical protein CM15mP49_13650 [Actinomycetota bacterium]